MKINLLKHVGRLKVFFSLLILGVPILGFSINTTEDFPEEKLLIEVLDEISRDHQVYFTYDSDLIKGITVDYEKREGESVRSILARVLSEVSMDFKIFEERFVILYRNDERGLKSLEKMIAHMEEIVKDRKEAISNRQLSPVQQLTTDKWSVVNRNRLVLNISGRVIDVNGEPLIGVNILVKGTNTGTTTDIDGRFSISDIDDQAVLVLSYIGYQIQEVTVNGQTSLTIIMLEDVQTLDEVVVVGYGTQKKSDLTGSVSSLKGEEFKNKSLTQFTEMLTGTIAGFNSNQGTSAQGGATMEIRGPTSITGGTSPLIVLDGVIFNGSLRDINPYDIESINVMKDASSAAVFGAKAASGIVFVTTSTGKLRKPTRNVSAKFGQSYKYNERRRLGTEDYIKFRQDAMRTFYPDSDINFYTHPDELPSNVSRQEWLAYNDKALDDYTEGWI